MANSFPNLFSSIQVGKYTLKNRIVNAGHAAHFHGEGGMPSERYVDYVRERAKGGAAMIILGHCVVYNDGDVPMSMANYDDRIIPVYQQMARATHDFEVPNDQNVVDVRMPIDATLYAGSVYLAPDEPQYLLFFRTACEGLSFLFDHIREPVPAIAELFTDDPPVGDSRTYAVGPLEMKEADLVGTSIGTLEDGNAFVDFGVNDNFGRLPTPQHPNAHGRFLSAVCIYTFFDPDTASYLRSVEHPQLVAEEGLCP